MMEFPKNLRDARIMISNDDSIHSDGIKALEEIVRPLCPNVWVVAPETQQSAAGHSLTIHSPLRIKEYDERHVSVYGTPTDSVLLGISKIMKGFRPHLVLSGINHGRNVADDVTYSGTVAAAIEATLMSVPSIALSQQMGEMHGSWKPDFDLARKALPGILKSLQGKSWDDNVLLNINFPMKVAGVTPEVRVCPQGHYSMAEQEMVYCTDPRGRPYFWVGAQPDCDEDDDKVDAGALKAGHITVTPLSLNLTHHPTLKTLREALA